METAEYELMNRQSGVNWWYRSRKQLVEWVLSDKANTDLGAPFLDIASAMGDNAEQFKDLAPMVSLDISSFSRQVFRNKNLKNFVQADATKLPFADSSFAGIIALDAIEHFADDQLSIEEFHRVLKPGGFCMITVPALQLLWSPHDEAFHHYRRYTQKQLKKLVEPYFEVKFVSYWNFFLFLPVAIMRLWSRVFSNSKKSNFALDLSPTIEKVLAKVQNCERSLLKRGVRFPVGVSLVALVQKRSDVFKGT